MNEALDRIRGICRGILEFEDMELVHLEMKREGGGRFLRLFIDREGGVSVEDCARVSRRLSARMDMENPIEEPYRLEVSSPGLDRPLYTERDYARFAGHQVRVSTYAPLEGRRNFVGCLVGIVDGAVRIALPDGSQVDIPLETIARARLEPQFQTHGKRAGAKGRHA
jgi:ribosome maturation factor RimP